MKILVTWLRKNGNCQCWTNANRTEQLEMGIVTLRNGIERKASNLLLDSSNSTKSILS